MSSFPENSAFLKAHGKGVSQGVADRMRERHKRIIGYNRDSIEGKTVLDLACNNGRWTWAGSTPGPGSCWESKAVRN